MLVKIEARILIFPGTDFHFPSTSVPPGTFFRLCHAISYSSWSASCSAYAGYAPSSLEYITSLIGPLLILFRRERQTGESSATESLARNTMQATT